MRPFGIYWMGSAALVTGWMSVAQAATPAAPAGKPESSARTPEEQKLLEEIFRSIETYEADAKEFKRDIQLLIEKRYEEKRNALSNSYEHVIRDLEVTERKERLDAIAQFEEFLRRYPNNPKYTADVTFRLAELYYERSSDEHIVALREYEEKLKTIDPSKA